MAAFQNKEGKNLLDKETYFEFLEHVPGGLLRYRADDNFGELDIVNTGVLDIFGCKNFQEFSELTGNCFKGMVLPDDWERVESTIREQIKDDNFSRLQYRIKRADGEIRWIDNSGRLVIDSSGNRWFYVTILDITPQVKVREELERDNERLEIITALSNDVLFDIECKSGETNVYGDFKGRFGREPEQSDLVVHRRCKEDCTINIHSHDLSHLIEQLKGDSLVDFETSTEGADGNPIWYRYQSVVLYDDDGKPIRHVGRLLDTHEMVMRETQFRHKAERDALTNLYNRSAALDRIDTILNSETRPCTLITVDVDDFKSVNDTYGHPEGDRVLKDLGIFLSQIMRSEDIVARMGGDEFAVFAPGLGPGRAMNRILDHLTKGAFDVTPLDSESCPTNIPGSYSPSENRAKPTISVGAACCMNPPISFEELYAASDEALYRAKNSGKARYDFIVIQ